MTFKFNNSYINETYTVTGPYEKKGPLSKYFDYSFDNLYCGAKTWEQAEINIIKKTYSFLKNKPNLFISGDLLNQIIASTYSAKDFDLPFIGIYSACSTSVLGLILASLLVDNNSVNNILVSASSHNCSAEKQFRYPIEYGGPKKKTTTFTSNGCGMALISNNKSEIKIESGTIGKIIDLDVKDVNYIGAVMAPAAAYVINEHLKNLNRSIDYYDMVYTGDLGLYGMKILKDLIKQEYNIDLINYNDCGVMIYDLNKQSVYSGASGPACLPLVSYSYILNQMKEKKLKKVLLVATGSLHSTTMLNEKLSIPSIAHAISLEVL